MPAAPFKVKAVFEYKSEEPDDLKFPNGQIITVTEDDDDDWYTGEYLNASGDKVAGIFPRNFVEKYEPAIPSRPQRTPKRPTPAEATHETTDEPALPQVVEPVKAQESEPHQDTHEPPAPEAPSAVTQDPPPSAAPAAAVAPKPSRSGPPPVADKPSTSSFKDRIAAFNKGAAAPVAPFKPGGQGNTSSTFIKKPFVAPPPSKNSYVPQPREPPPQKIYRREEDPSLQTEASSEAHEPARSIDHEEPAAEDQPKPTSLKERIALLQKQQQEQAQRHAEPVQKKEKPKKPPKKRVEAAEEPEGPTAESLERLDTNETVGKGSSELPEDRSDVSRPQPPERQMSTQSGGVPPLRELVSDTNDADDSNAADTEDAQEISTEEDRPKSKGQPIIGGLEPIPAKKEEPEEEQDEENDENEESGEEEEDPEVRRKRELRERMAKMSGGMGMMGMFGAPGGAAPAPRKTRPSGGESTHKSSEQHEEDTAARAPPVPLMALPGMSNQHTKREEEPVPDDSDDEETAHPTPLDTSHPVDDGDDYVSSPPNRMSTGRSVASTTSDRNVPPVPQRESRPPPPPAPEARPVPTTPQSPASRSVPPLPPMRAPEHTNVSKHDDEHDDGEHDQPERKSMERQPQSPTSAPPVPRNRPESSLPNATRQPPSSPPVSSPAARPPPPPPPAPPSRRNTSDSYVAVPSKTEAADESEDEVTEYDGDYDTDIASSAKHKDALKSHNRDSSFDEGVLTDDAAAKAPTSPPARAVPPLPPMMAQRDPPPPPPQAQPKSRKSIDAPRAAPPPVPPPSQHLDEDEGEYDPFRYSAPQHGLSSPGARPPHQPFLSSPREELEEPDMYGGPSFQPPRMPPPPPGDRSLPPPPNDQPRQSLDVKRSATVSRRSMEQSRPSGEHGIIAQDVDLGQSSLWWTQQSLLPPSLQNRPDILHEMEQSSKSQRGGRSIVSKEVYILYQDYSQTTIRASWDANDPAHATLEQSHDRPPATPRKDQLEAASENFGKRIITTANNAGTAGSTIADGSSHAFVLDLIHNLPGALFPVGNRSFGALVYANLANASTQQFDEIRPGDIVTFRNAKFAGHRGTMKTKYTAEWGKPDHVGVVIEWDGSKKKIRVWMQTSGEEGGKGKRAKVREESCKVGDLKSGEVRVWRVMGRGFVGWGDTTTGGERP